MRVGLAIAHSQIVDLVVPDTADQSSLQHRLEIVCKRVVMAKKVVLSRNI